MKQKKKTKKFEEDYFDGHFRTHIGEFTPQRDREMTRWFRASMNFINRYIPLKNAQGKTLLEFGCAYGSASVLLHEFGFDVTATDISKLAVKRAKQLHPQITFRTHDMEKLFKTKKKFDYAFAMDVIEHLPKPEQAIKNVYKILKPGGIAIMSSPNDFPYKVQDPTHISVKSPKEWKKIFKEAGFSSVVTQPATYFPPLLYRIHWRLNFVFPIAVFSSKFLSTVFIFAKKKKS